MRSPDPAYPRQRLLITLTIASGLPAAFVRGIVAYVYHDSLTLGVIGFLTLLVPPLILVVLLLGPPTRQTFSLAQAYALLGILLGGSLFGILFWYVIAIAAGPIGGEPAFVLVELVLMSPYIVMLVASRRTARDVLGDSASASFAQIGVVAGAYVVAFAVGAGFGGDVESWQLGEELATGDAVEAAGYRVQACAIGRALARPDGGYPRTLVEMGPAGDKCLDSDHAENRVRRVHIEYQPEPPDSLGRVPSFIIRTRSKKKSSAKGHIISAIGDTSGRLVEMAGTSDHAQLPTEGLHLDPVAQLLADIRTCARLAREYHPERKMPASLAEIAAGVRQFEDGDYRAHHCWPTQMHWLADGSRPDSVKYIDAYRIGFSVVRDGDGEVSDLVLDARPRAYGVSGIRSYLLRFEGGVRTTLADRGAGAADPVFRECEYGTHGYPNGEKPAPPVTCVALPGARAPVVALVHDSTWVGKELFEVHFRDPADPRLPADSTYGYRADCPKPPSDGSLQRRNGYVLFKPRTSFSCNPVHHVTGKLADSVEIVVYVQDVTGAVGVARSFARRAPGPGER